MIKPTDKIALLAKTKSGKSYLGKQIHSIFPRRIIIDTTHEYLSEHGEIIYGFDLFCKRVSEVSNLDQFCLIFRFGFEETKQAEIFEEICRIVFYLQDVFFVVEEIHLHSSTHQINSFLLKIATIGSHRNIGYLLTTQRPSLIHKTLLTQCDHIFIGSLIDDQDISYVKGFLREYAKKISQFPARHFIYWNLGQISQIKT